MNATQMLAAVAAPAAVASPAVPLAAAPVMPLQTMGSPVAPPTPSIGTPLAKQPPSARKELLVEDEMAELVPNDECTLCLPHHLFVWKDLYENERYTLMVYLPTGATKSDVKPQIVANRT